MRVGVFLAGFDTGWPDFRRLWTNADALGYDSGWIMDNVIGPLPVDPVTPVFEAYTTLAALADATNRMRIGTLVSPVGRRHPALLAKMVADIDHISGGRMTLGIGVDDEDRHYLPWGMEYPPSAVRIARVGEAIRVVHQLWSNDSTTWHGEHYSLSGAILYPKPIQTPHPPVWVGVVRPENTELLRIAGELADGVNVFHAVDENIAGMRHVVESAAVRAGRDPGDITWSRLMGVTFAKTVGDIDTAVAQVAARSGEYAVDIFRHFRQFEEHVVGPPEYCVERLQREADLGFDEVIVHFSFDMDKILRTPVSQLHAMRTFADKVIPHL